eukprot:NODE_1532_length_1118_cov_397.521167.p1 GENE.NODE_1532_length_1118_cov_397.521167~~NODE_1532_length_1118_cov_397.521167.p1  ORF type:complete len:325 (+),score=89.80 NODE_1532_length_1118_cov_397.521167:127-975(+)
MVREAADLDSRVLEDLTAGTVLGVEEGRWLDDEDRTPQLRISAPVKGGVTPYLASPSQRLIEPPADPAACHGIVGEIARSLQARARWRVADDSTARVREAADLRYSRVVRGLAAGTVLAVEEGQWLDDADATPRLRISAPVEGWVTPYLASSGRRLIEPPAAPTFCGGILGEIARSLQAGCALPRRDCTRWRVADDAAARVREAADLDSRVLGCLHAGTILAVQEGRWLDDADATPRLRISAPVEGWVTPYLASSRQRLIEPPTAFGVRDGILGEIARSLQA